ncbi:MAG TPA: holo-ACP synthase [Steroidobacteraceae bacterium]
MCAPSQLPKLPHASGNIRVGIDIVRVSHIADSIERFGQRFLRRIYTAEELAYADTSPALRIERLAARFAAKEAALKALRLADTGVGWTDLEVHRAPSGDCELRLHRSARTAVLNDGISEIALSLSHEGDYATAIVMAQRGSDVVPPEAIQPMT